MIKAVIIDDEADARNSLRGFLREASVDVQVLGEAGDIAEAQQLIERTQPELIFLDVQLRHGTGFHLLARMPKLSAEVIFVTAYDKYAIQAFKMAAFGYLLKPLQLNELDAVLERFAQRFERASTEERSRILVDNHNANGDRKLVLSNMNGFRVTKLQQIIYLRGEVNYTRFHLEGGEQILVSKTLREYEFLDELGFFRIHQSSMINLDHLTEYKRGEGGSVILSNGDLLAVSRRRKQAFIDRFLMTDAGRKG